VSYDESSFLKAAIPAGTVLGIFGPSFMRFLSVALPPTNNMEETRDATTGEFGI
jgi:hypothetical protein